MRPLGLGVTRNNICAKTILELRRLVMTLPRGVAIVAAFALAYGCFVGPSGPAVAAGIFTVGDVPVDATTDSSADARAAAIAMGKRDAFRRLFRRLVLTDDQAQLPTLASELLDQIIGGFEIDDERVSPVRYRAKLTVDFKQEGVRDLLRGLNIRFAEAISKPALVVPVFREGSRAVLWGEPADWRNAWFARPAGSNLVPLILPLGDVLDISTLSAEQAIAPADDALLALAERYGAKDVVVAFAELALPREPTGFADQFADQLADQAAPEAAIAGEGPASGEAAGAATEDVPSMGTMEGARLNLFIRRTGPGGETMTDERVLVAVPDDTRQSFLTRAAGDIVTRLEDQWKQANLLRFDRQNVLRVVTPLGGLPDWVNLRRRLIELPVVVGVELAVLSRRAVEVRLRYLGELEQLKRALTRADLTLVEARDGWLLQLRRSADTEDDGQRRAL